MCTMHFKHYLIICLLNQITLKILVSSTSMDLKKYKSSLPEKVLYHVANDVCSYLEYDINVPLHTCREQFWKASFPPIVSKESPVKIRCTTKHSRRFLIPASANIQLVLLLPEPISDTETDLYSIVFSRVNPHVEHGIIYPYSDMNYTLWSTELVEGSPVHWLGGDEVPQYNELLVPEHKNYEVEIQMYKDYVNGTMPLKGSFTWNTTGDDDVCFDVVNSCKSNITDFLIWPNQKREILIDNLPLDTMCNFEVKGLFGSTKIQYQTPPCKNETDCVPEVPQNVTISLTEHTSETWNVFVNWAKPYYLVEAYNVTLHTDTDTSQIVDGKQTEAVFEGISGEGTFHVKMFATFGRYEAHTSRRAYFPVGVPGASVGRQVFVGGLVSALLVFNIFCIWRRRRHTAPPKHYPSVVKVPVEVCTEAAGGAGALAARCADRWEIAPDKLALHEVIGEGAFGLVRRATLTPQGIHVAVKMLKEFPSPEEVRSFLAEMELMKSVGVHAHIVSLVGCCSARRPLIVAEFCSRGDLLTYLRCTWDIMVSKRNAKYYNNNNIETSDYRNDVFKWKTQENSTLVVNKLYELQGICDKELTALDLLSFCRQIAMGMEFLAANRVVHRDLAARNVLVTSDRTLKIADFGLSRDVYEENQYKQKGNGKMPIKWMALESLTRRIYTTQSDVWSFGVVVWEVATLGASPYPSVPAARLPRLLRAGYRMPRPANCSQQLYDIMVACWRAHPRDRPTFVALHARLDELVLGASAHDYLPLELDPLDAPPTPLHRRRFSLFGRGKRKWSRTESYERPLQPSHSNHYTSLPVTMSKGPPV